jgi:hypothetical protein
MGFYMRRSPQLEQFSVVGGMPAVAVSRASWEITPELKLRQDFGTHEYVTTVKCTTRTLVRDDSVQYSRASAGLSSAFFSAWSQSNVTEVSYSP